jgi:soluble lytic murein transglycosylase-like protein
VSIEAVLGTAAGDASGALAASERVERLQALVAQVEQGPAGFAAELETAQARSASAGSEASSDENASPTAASGITEGASAGAGGSAYIGLIDRAAAQNGVEPSVLYGLIQQESDFDPSASSNAGAEGLTQLMPGTASSLGVTEPLNPAQSIEGGARYLGELLRQFGGNVTDALAAYNAGPGAVESYGGVPPYSETQQYVSKVLENAAAERQSAPADSLPATATQDVEPTSTGALA